MYAEERRRKIASLTAVEGRVTVSDLAHHFDVTAETIRRDLAQLDGEGAVHRGIEVGILEHERRATQPLHVDAEFDVDIQRSVDDHDIHSVLDYRRLREAIVEECTQAHVNLIETLSEQDAARLLADFQEIRSLRLRISKPMAFSDCAAVGVEIQITR